MSDPVRLRRLRGILFLVGAVSLFGIMDGIGKLLTDRHSVAQVVWARYAFAVPVVLVLAPPALWGRLLQTGRPLLQGFRALLPLLASLSVIAGLALLPLADNTAITFASPLLVAALAVPLLGERISLRSWLGILVGFAGVLVIARPGAGALALAALYPLGCAFFFALFQLTTRLLHEDDPHATLGWTILVGLAVMTPVVAYGWEPVSGSDWLLMIASGLIFGVSQFLFIRAYAYAPAGFLAPFTYAQIVAALAFGFVAFGHVPDVPAFVGTGIIILAGLYLLREQTRGA